MPELPEVEMVRRGLAAAIIGKTIQSIEVLHPKPVSATPEIVDILPGLTITSVNRRGKLLYLTCNKPNTYVAIHLKMTGQLLYQDANETKGGGHTLTKSDLQLPHKHTRLQLEFTDGSNLYFNDLRLFGYVKLMNKEQLDTVLEKYGIEPGTSNFTKEAFLEIFTNKKTTLKALLLKQELIAGLGNIYVDEACYYAKVRPTRRVHTLTKKQKELLFTGCANVIAESIASGGTTFYSFKHTDGQSGSYLDKLKVFGKQGTPCPRCGSEILKIKHAGRGTHYCKQCQK